MEALAPPAPPTTRRRGHRLPSDVWPLLTAAEAPHQARSSVCRHCERPVPHHHKSEKARAHLLRCEPFRAKMAQCSEEERPAWFSHEPKAPKAKRTSLARDPAPAKKRKAPSKGKSKSTEAAAAAPGQNVPPAQSPTRQSSAPATTTAPASTLRPARAPTAAPAPAPAPTGAAPVSAPAPVVSPVLAPVSAATMSPVLASILSPVRSVPGSIPAPTPTPPRPIPAPVPTSTPVHFVLSNAAAKATDANDAVATVGSLDESVEDFMHPDDSSLAVEDETENEEDLATGSSAGEHEPHHDALTGCNVRDALAMHIYTTGSRLDSVAEANLLAAFRYANPGVSLPTPDELRGALLSRIHHRVTRKVKADMNLSVNNTVICNSWWEYESNGAIRELDSGKRTVKFVVVNEAQTFYLGASRDEPSKWNSVDFVASELAKTINFSQRHICGAITDSSATCSEARRKLKAAFPSKFFQGCVSHGLRLMIRDIFECHHPAAHNLISPIMLLHIEPSSGPLAPLQHLPDTCRLVIDCFKHDQELQDKLTTAEIRIAFPVKDRQWEQLMAGFQSILSALPALRNIVRDPAFTTGVPVYLRDFRGQIRQILLDPGFSSLLEKAVRVLEPVNAAIETFETKDVPCSEVFSCFAKTLPEAFAGLGSAVTEDERAHLMLLNQQQFGLLYGEGHGIAYLLDPRFIGDGLSVQIRKGLEDIIYSFPALCGDDNTTDPEDAQLEIAQQLTEYVIEATRERTKKTFRYTLLARGKKSVLQYWLTDGQQWPRLQQLACRVFCLPSTTLRLEQLVTSLASENPEKQGWSSEHNRCIDKLQFIRINALLLRDA